MLTFYFTLINLHFDDPVWTLQYGHVPLNPVWLTYRFHFGDRSFAFISGQFIFNSDSTVRTRTCCRMWQCRGKGINGGKKREFRTVRELWGIVSRLGTRPKCKCSPAEPHMSASAGLINMHFRCGSLAPLCWPSGWPHISGKYCWPPQRPRCENEIFIYASAAQRLIRGIHTHGTIICNTCRSAHGERRKAVL